MAGSYSETKQVFTYNDACVERGPTIVYNAQAFAGAQKAVLELVSAVLKPK